MPSQEVTVNNMNGIHCRPSSVIVRAAMAFKSDLRAECANGSANLKSMIEIITLALHAGDSATLFAEGSDADVALAEMVKCFTDIYDYPDK
jgi:phosphocarrier protein HPr